MLRNAEYTTRQGMNRKVHCLSSTLKIMKRFFVTLFALLPVLSPAGEQDMQEQVQFPQQMSAGRLLETVARIVARKA